MGQPNEAAKSFMQSILDVVEKVGNKVPHPVIIFLILIAIVVALSHILYMTGASVTYQAIVPETSDSEEAEPDIVPYDTGTSVTYDTINEKDYHIESRTVAPRSLLTTEGIRFIYSSLIPSFMGFTAVGLIIVAMVGVGVA